MTGQKSRGRPGVVLFHPMTGFWEGFRSAPSLPLNMLHASSLIADEFDVTIIDPRLHADWEKRLARAVENEPVFAGISAMTGPAAVSSIRIARAVKRIADIPVALGGVHPTIVAETALREHAIDYVVCGEGEIPLQRLAQSLAQRGDTENIPGIRTKQNPVRAVDPQEFEERIDLEQCPEIPYHLVHAEQYLQYFNGVSNYISMETSRGCPYRCRYCYHGRPEYSGWRAQSPGRVFERAKYVKEHVGAGGIYFVDDNFFIDTDRATHIAESMARLNLKWQVQGIDIAALRKMDDGYLSFLASSGLTRITIGIDSGSDRIRKKLHKQLLTSEVVETIARLKNYPIIVYCSFIVNFPGETAEDLKSTMRLIGTLYDANPFFRNSPVYQFVPFPGTQLALELDHQGFRWPATFIQWGAFSFETGYGVDNTGVGSDYYKALYFTTLFTDGKFEEFLSSRILKILSRLYKPIARFRLKKYFMKYMPERSLFLAMEKILMLLRGYR